MLVMAQRFVLPEEVLADIARDGALRAVRDWRGLSPLNLSGRANVDRARIVAFEDGTGDLAGEEIDRIASALCVPAELLTKATPGRPPLRIVPKAPRNSTDPECTGHLVSKVAKPRR
jgi:hypothetical protein